MSFSKFFIKDIISEDNQNIKTNKKIKKLNLLEIKLIRLILNIYFFIPTNL